MKRCSKCERDLPLTTDHFCKNKATRDGFHTQCKPCRSAIVAEHNRRRRERQIENAGRIPGACDACKNPLAVGQRGAHYDHNHGTGEFRGWLCGHCNLALGNAGDNPEILMALASYLLTNGYATTRLIEEIVDDKAVEVVDRAKDALPRK